MERCHRVMIDAARGPSNYYYLYANEGKATSEGPFFVFDAKNGTTDNILHLTLMGSFVSFALFDYVRSFYIK